MKTEEFQYFKAWDGLCNSIIKLQNLVAPIHLYALLKDWTHLFKNSQIVEFRQKYDIYFNYYDAINFTEFDFSMRWYSLEDLIRNDIIEINVSRLDGLVLNCRNVMHEILVFKTNICCSRCGDDDLRAWSDKERNKVYLICDLCNYISDLNGEELKEINEKLLPINPFQQKVNKLLPSSYR